MTYGRRQEFQQISVGQLGLQITEMDDTVHLGGRGRQERRGEGGEAGEERRGEGGEERRGEGRVGFKQMALHVELRFCLHSPFVWLPLPWSAVGCCE